jgi:muconolactone D-isomerase
MEFLTRAVIRVPRSTPSEAVQDLIRAEAAVGHELRRQGHLLRIWRLPGAWANVTLWEARDATELHDLLTRLPLHPYMKIRVTPLAVHPLEADAS